MDLASLIRDIPDFPKPGILFKDITPLLMNPQGFREAVKRMADAFKDAKVDAVVAVESRGFIFGGPAALELDSSLVIVRKPGKLPYKTRRISYELEYGTDTLEIHEDAVKKGDRVLIVDDLLATGGTVHAVAKMLKDMGAEIVGCSFVIELDFLKGRDRLADYQVLSLIHF
jgi:adenine phosphoribosyltransferase